MLRLEQNEDPKEKAVEFFKKFGLPLEDVDDLVEAVMAARHGSEAETKEDDNGEDDENGSNENEEDDDDDIENDEIKIVDVCYRIILK